MNNELLIKLINELVNNNSSKEKETCSDCDVASPWIIGEKYFIRTVTMHMTGKLVFATDKELVLTDAAWIADSGRFNNALKNGELDEVEPFVDEIIVNRASVIDATKWRHDLPREVK